MLLKGAEKKIAREGWEAESFVLIGLRIVLWGYLNAEGRERGGGLKLRIAGTTILIIPAGGKDNNSRLYHRGYGLSSRQQAKHKIIFHNNFLFSLR
jgi:hypothetical protein